MTTHVLLSYDKESSDAANKFDVTSPRERVFKKRRWRYNMIGLPRPEASFFAKAAGGSISLARSHPLKVLMHVLLDPENYPAMHLLPNWDAFIIRNVKEFLKLLMKSYSSRLTKFLTLSESYSDGALLIPPKAFILSCTSFIIPYSGKTTQHHSRELSTALILGRARIGQRFPCLEPTRAPKKEAPPTTFSIHSRHHQ